MMASRVRSAGRWIQAALATLAFLSVMAIQVWGSAPQDAKTSLEERWFLVQMDGQRAGWMHTKLTRGEQETTIETEMRFKIARGEIEIPIQMASRFTGNTATGAPISAWSMQKYAQVPVETEWKFEADGIIVRTKQGAQVDETREPLPDGVWLTPIQVLDESLKAFKAGLPTQTLRSVDPTAGLQPFNTTWTLVASDVEIENAEGKKVKVLKYKTVTDIMPSLEGAEYCTPDGEMIRTDMPMGGMELRMIRTTREDALQKAKAPELMVKTFVTPDKPIPQARSARKVVMDLSVTAGSLPDLPTSGSQTFVRTDDRSGRLTVTMEPTIPAPAEDAANSDFRAATRFMDSNDAAIRDLVHKAVESVGSDQMTRAEAMRRFVYGYIDKKALDVAFATASEIAQNRTGDCSEHGVLLAAMLRADGIPARVVSGLLYVDEFMGAEGIFGYHMWAQALIDGKWVDFDATLPTARFDATHIGVAPATLKDGAMGMEMAALLPLMGRLEIKIVSTDPQR